MRTTTFVAVLLSSLSLVACGGGGGNDNDDVDDDDDDVADPVDAGPGDTPDAGPVACTVSTESFGDKGALVGGAGFSPGELAADASDDSLEFGALLEAAPPADAISVLLYAGFGVFADGPIVPGTYTITGDETNFATCGVCVLLATNATPEGWDDDYMATGGTVTITAAGTAAGMSLTGSLANLTFHHVVIDEETFETTLAPDDCVTAIASATFDAVLEAEPRRPPML